MQSSSDDLGLASEVVSDHLRGNVSQTIVLLFHRIRIHQIAIAHAANTNLQLLLAVVIVSLRAAADLPNNSAKQSYCHSIVLVYIRLRSHMQPTSICTCGLLRF